MTVYNTSRKGNTANLSVGNSDRLFVMHHTIDLAEVQADNPAFASDDQVAIFDVPADCVLLTLAAKIGTAVTSTGTSETIEIGDEDDDDRYVASATTLTAGTVLTQAVTTNQLRYFPDADQLLLKFSATTSVAAMAGTVIVTAVFMDCSPITPTTTVTVVNT